MQRQNAFKSRQRPDEFRSVDARELDRAQPPTSITIWLSASLRKDDRGAAYVSFRRWPMRCIDWWRSERQRGQNTSRAGRLAKPAHAGLRGGDLCWSISSPERPLPESLK